MNEDKIKEYSLYRYGLQMSHIFFVDDNLLFFHAQISDIQTVQEILELYGKFRANRLI